MNAPAPCPECGAALPPDAPQGLCPRCLSAAAFAPGERVQYFGNYELMEEIALGGMGVVWKARQLSLDRVVALKMIRGGMLATAVDVRRFHVEAQAAASLQHPGIVAIHEIGEHEGQHYYTMDFVDGKNLAEFCDGHPLPVRQAAEIIAATADAVQFAHQRAILHRDLKPQNVMIDATGTPRLTDFGLARRIDGASALTQSGAILGSPSYMPPEQAQGRLDRVGLHSDVYALGAILFEMLTGREPFRGESPAETMVKVIDEPPPAPSRLNGEVPRDLETICLKCLEKEPERRYATAREFADDVRRFLAGEPILARRAGVLRKVESWVRRNPWKIFGTAFFSVLLLACTAYRLAEEKDFLLAQQATPELARATRDRVAGPLPERGSYTQQARDLQLAYKLSLLMLFFAIPMVARLERGPAPRAPWIKPATALLGALFASSVILLSLWLIHIETKAFAWEGYQNDASWTWFYLMPCMLFILSVRLLAASLRIAGLLRPAEELTISQESAAKIEAALLAGDAHEAMQCAHSAMPGAVEDDVRAVVARIAARLEAAAPGAIPSLPPRPSSTRGVILLSTGLGGFILLFAAFYSKFDAALLYGSFFAGVLLVAFVASLPAFTRIPIAICLAVLIFFFETFVAPGAASGEESIHRHLVRPISLSVGALFGWGLVLIVKAAYRKLAPGTRAVDWEAELRKARHPKE